MSGEVRREAMDLYKVIVREEADPLPVLSSFIKDLEDKGVDLSEFVGNSDELFQDQLWKLDIDELISLLRKLAVAKEGTNKEERKTKEDVDNGGSENGNPVVKKPLQQVHEQLIDIDMIRKKSANRTATAHTEL